MENGRGGGGGRTRTRSRPLHDQEDRINRSRKSVDNAEDSLMMNAGGGDSLHLQGQWVTVSVPQRVTSAVQDKCSSELEEQDSGNFTISSPMELQKRNKEPALPQLQLSTQGHGSKNLSSSSSPPPVLGTDDLKSVTLVRSTEAQSVSPNYAYDQEPYDSLNGSNCDMGHQEEGDSTEGDPLSVGYLRGALDNFNSLYQEKVQLIDDLRSKGDPSMKSLMMQKKVNVLECWAKDVSVQNIVLIQTVEELERQSEEKLKLLQEKVVESASLANKHRAIVDSYEKRIQALLDEQAASNGTRKHLQEELVKIQTHYRKVHDRLHQVEKDNDSLITLVTRIRDLGVWDVAGLEFHKRTFAQMFDLYPNLPGTEVQTVFTREKGHRIREAEERIESLEGTITKLETSQHELQSVLQTKDSAILVLETNLKHVEGQLKRCAEECEHYKQCLIETQERLLNTTKELQIQSQCPPENADQIQVLIKELMCVKEQLNISVQESQSAKTESNMIRKEFSERLKAMQESQKCLQSEFCTSIDFRTKMEEKDRDLERIRDQIEAYKGQCEKSEEQLNQKEKTIEELQSTIRQLTNKCSESKRPWNDHFVKCNALNASSTSLYSSKPKATFQRSQESLRKGETSESFNLGYIQKERLSLTDDDKMQIDAILKSKEIGKLPELERAYQFCTEKAKGTTQTKKDQDKSENRRRRRVDDKTYDMLMGVALETSKQLQNEEVAGNKKLTSIRVVAGYRSHHRDSNRNRNSRATTNDMTPTKLAPESVVKAEVQRNMRTPILAHRQPSSTKTLGTSLTELPEEPYLSVVQEWIHSSNKSNQEGMETKSHVKSFNSNNNNVGKLLPPKPIKKAITTRSKSYKVSREEMELDRLIREKNAYISASQTYAEKTRQIEQNISDIKQEWNKIFNNVDDASCSSGMSRNPDPAEDGNSNLTPRRSSFVPNNNLTSMHVPQPNAVNKNTNAQPLKPSSLPPTEKDRTMEEILLEKEKQKEEFLVEIRQQNIEIKMQKLKACQYKSIGLRDNCRVMDSMVFLKDCENTLKKAKENLEALKTDNEATIFNVNALRTKSQLFASFMNASEVEDKMRQFSDILNSEDTPPKFQANGNADNSETRDELLKLEWEIEMMRNVNEQLQTNLFEQCEENLKLHEAVDKLTLLRQETEEQLLHKKTEEMTMANGFLEAAQKHMNEMREAYDMKEKELANALTEIVEKDSLICQYQQYCASACQRLGESNSLEIQLDEKRKELITLQEENQKMVKEHERASKVMKRQLNKLTHENKDLRAGLSVWQTNADRVDRSNTDLLTRIVNNENGVTFSDEEAPESFPSSPAGTAISKSLNNNEDLNPRVATYCGSGDAIPISIFIPKELKRMEAPSILGNCQTPNVEFFSHLRQEKAKQLLSKYSSKPSR